MTAQSLMATWEELELMSTRIDTWYNVIHYVMMVQYGLSKQLFLSMQLRVFGLA